MRALHLMVNGFTDVMKQSGSFCQTYIFPNLSSKETGQLCYFDGMFESILSVACPIFHLAKQTNQFRSDAMYADFQYGGLAFLPHGLLYFILRFFDHLFNSRWMNPSVYNQLLKSDPRHFSPNRIKA